MRHSATPTPHPTQLRPLERAPTRVPQNMSINMRSLLMTMIDLRQEPFQRAQHVTRMLAALSAETVVVTKVKVLDRSLSALMRDALRCSATVEHQGKVTTVALHPPLNYAQALAAGIVQGDLTRPPSVARRALATALSLLGILRDAMLVPSFVVTVLVKTRGTFDVCVVDGPWTGTAAWLLRALGRIRQVVYEDIDYVAGGQMLKLREAYVAALERFAIRRADLVISAGWRLGENRRQTTGREVLVIPNGADPAKFAAAHAKRPHPPTLVYIGHLSHYAGVDLAIRALPLIQARIPGARLLVVGDGDTPYIAGLAKLAAAQGVTDSVDLRGRIAHEQIPDVLAESDIGLATSRLTPLRVYAFPYKILEYMAAGVAVMCTRGTEAEEILRRHPAGTAIEFTPEAFATAAIALLGDPQAYALARAAGLAAAQVFTWERAMDAERDAVLRMRANARPQRESGRA